MSTIAVSYQTHNLQLEAEKLAKVLKLPCVPTETMTQYDFCLLLTSEHLQLMQPNTSFKPLYIDFLHGALAYRRLHGGGKKQTLAKAIGIKNQKLPSIIDATAGLGRDSFVLACLGCQVTMVERSPVLVALLQDALTHLYADKTASQALQLTVTHADSIDYLTNLSAIERPDVIYCDPMYPERDKSALVKKDMQMLKALIGEDMDSGALLDVALQTARLRVVVKRPKQASYINDTQPDIEYTTRKHRFDVYLIRV